MPERDPDRPMPSSFSARFHGLQFDLDGKRRGIRGART